MINEKEIRKRLDQIIRIQNETGLELKVDIGLMIHDMSDLFDLIEELQQKVNERDKLIEKQENLILFSRDKIGALNNELEKRERLIEDLDEIIDKLKLI